MTRKDTEMALIQLGQVMKAIVEGYAPNANHMSINCINGQLSVSACEFDGEAGEYIEKDILKAVQFKDGDLLIDGQYIKPDGHCFKPAKEDVA